MKRVTKKPEDMTVVFLEAVLMPNGELMSCGHSLGFMNKFKGMSGECAVYEMEKDNERVK